MGNRPSIMKRMGMIKCRKAAASTNKTKLEHGKIKSVSQFQGDHLLFKRPPRSRTSQVQAVKRLVRDASRMYYVSTTTMSISCF